VLPAGRRGIGELLDLRWRDVDLSAARSPCVRSPDPARMYEPDSQVFDGSYELPPITHTR
jgi:hypothetical protein